MQPGRNRLNEFLISLIPTTRRSLNWIGYLTRRRFTIDSITIGVAVYALVPRCVGLGRSLWLDETWIANSLVAQSLKGMFYYDSWLQSSPPLFLLLARIPVALFGLSNTMLRMVPLVMGILAAVSMFLLARRVLSPQFALLAWVLLVLSPVAIGSSRLLKQYSSELAASATILLVCALYIEKATRSRFWLLVGAVVTGLLLAYSVAFIVPGIILAVCMSPIRSGAPSNAKAHTSSRFLRASLLGAVAAGILIAEYFLFVAPNSPDVLHAFFAMKNVGVDSFARLAAFECYVLIAELPLHHLLLGQGTISVVGVILLLGLSLAWLRFRKGRRKWLVLQVVCLLPCLLLIISDWFSWYPFTERTSLFLLPFVIVLVISSLQLASIFVLQKGRDWVRPLLNVALFCAVVITIMAASYNKAILAQNKVPEEDMDGAVSFLYQHVQPQDLLWVHASCSEGFKLYARMRGWSHAPAKFGHTGWPCCARGVSNYASSESLVRADLSSAIPDGFSGRIWLLFTSRPSHWEFVGLDEPQIMKSLLRNKGCVETPTPLFHNVGVSSFDCKSQN